MVHADHIAHPRGRACILKGDRVAPLGAGGNDGNATKSTAALGTIKEDASSPATNERSGARIQNITNRFAPEVTNMWHVPVCVYTSIDSPSSVSSASSPASFSYRVRRGSSISSELWMARLHELILSHITIMPVYLRALPTCTPAHVCSVANPEDQR